MVRYPETTLKIWVSLALRRLEAMTPKLEIDSSIVIPVLSSPLGHTSENLPVIAIVGRELKVAEKVD